MVPNVENDRIMNLLDSMLDMSVNRLKEFAKKKPDEPLTPAKITLLNRLLLNIKEKLSSDPGNAFLDLLDTENIPTISDAILILTQYQSAIFHFNKDRRGW